MWKSAEVKYTVAIILCDSISLDDLAPLERQKEAVGDKEYDSVGGDSPVQRIFDFIRRIKFACALNIAICRYHRGRLTGPVVGIDQVQEASGKEELIDAYVNLSALEFCHLSQR